MLAIGWFWVHAAPQPFEYSTCNTQHCWGSVDAHFQVVAISTLTILIKKVANTSIMSQCGSTAVWLCIIQCQKSLTLHWRSCSKWGITLSICFLPIKASDTLIMHNSEQISLQLPYLKDINFLMVSWQSFSEWGSDHVTWTFVYKGRQFVVYT
jgi:hypothetical protein